MYANGAIGSDVEVGEVVVELEPLVGAFADVVGLADGDGDGRIVRRGLDAATPHIGDGSTIFSKLGLEEDPDANRRVLDVLLYLDGARRSARRSGPTPPGEPALPARRLAVVTESTTPTAPLVRFEAIFAAHQRAVLAYTMRRTGTLADAEDAASETFAVAWRRLSAIPAEPLPWLYAVARRVLANQRRGNGRRQRLAAFLRVEDVPTPLRAGEDLDGPVFEALASLPPADQELLRLLAWEELRNHEIAEVLEITPNAVAIRLHRARARFAAALEKVSPGDDPKDPGRSRTLADVKGTQGVAWKGVAE